MENKIFKFWIRHKFFDEELDRYFEDYSKLHHYIEKHNIKDKDIVFIKTRKQNNNEEVKR